MSNPNKASTRENEIDDLTAQLRKLGGSSSGNGRKTTRIKKQIESVASRIKKKEVEIERKKMALDKDRAELKDLQAKKKGLEKEIDGLEKKIIRAAAQMKITG